MRFLSLLALASAAIAFVVNEGTTCTLYPESLTHQGLAVDDVPSIQQAFHICGINGTIIFTNNTFTIATVLNTTNLLNVDVILRGVLKFTDNIPYWRSNSWPVIFQNQVTAWLFGGTNVTFRGEGGWLDGNGQAWYTFSANTANLPGRPIVFTVFNSTNVLIDGLTILQPQFWAFFTWRSSNVSLTNYYTNATTDNPIYTTFNTDGFDSWNTDTILIENATIVTDDDCVAAKGNTTNMLVRNVTCHGSTGVTIGSIGQYPTTPDYVSNITFEDVTCIDGLNCAYVKTWQSAPEDQTENGDAGGGGGGLVKNVTFRNFKLQNVALPIQITQCIYASTSAGCNTSNLALEDISWTNFTGTSEYNIAASMYCAANHPCPGITFQDINIQSINETEGLPLYNTTLQSEVYQCANIVNQNGSGIPCNRVAPDDFSQFVGANVQ